MIPCQQYLRDGLSEGTSSPSTEKVDVGFQYKDVRVVWRGASQLLWEMLQAKALQGAEGKEWKTLASADGTIKEANTKPDIKHVKEDTRILDFINTKHQSLPA